MALTGRTRRELEVMVDDPTLSERRGLRARIVLAAAEGGSNTDLAAQLGCNPATVGKWRRRYSEQGLDGLLDEPRVGRPRQIDHDKVEQIIVDALQRPPPELSIGPWPPSTVADTVAPSLVSEQPTELLNRARHATREACQLLGQRLALENEGAYRLRRD